MIRINVQVTKEQNEELRKLAFDTRLSVAEHIRRAVEEYLSNLKEEQK